MFAALSGLTPTPLTAWAALQGGPCPPLYRRRYFRSRLQKYLLNPPKRSPCVRGPFGLNAHAFDGVGRFGIVLNSPA